MNSQLQPSSRNQSFARWTARVAFLSAMLSVCAFTLAVSQILLGHVPSISVFGVMVCTLPIAVVCTVLAVVLVGPRRCKLALASLVLFLLQFGVGYAVQSFLMTR